MRLEDIGFYTLSDKRAQTSTSYTPLWRCELLLGDRCNFNCPYCRRRGGPDLTWEQATRTVDLWAAEGLRNVRYSGGEPTLWPNLRLLVRYTRKQPSVRHIAISTNGSADWDLYADLIRDGVTDFSVSLDACCASTADTMSGGRAMLDHICRNIRRMSTRVYTTVGVVVTAENRPELPSIVALAAELGVNDIRLISAAQWNRPVVIPIAPDHLDRFPILRYRHGNIARGRHVRGLRKHDAGVCRLVLDDMAVQGDYHYPCIIHLREGGDPIGKVGADMRAERYQWMLKHNSHEHPICQANCLDVCVDYNNKAQTCGGCKGYGRICALRKHHEALDSSPV